VDEDVELERLFGDFDSDGDLDTAKSEAGSLTRARFVKTGRRNEDEEMKILGSIANLVTGAFRKQQVDVSGAEVRAISEMLVDMSGVGTAEAHSPERFTSQCMKMGLRLGYAVDMTLPKCNGEYWDLAREGDAEGMMSMLDREDPELLIGSAWMYRGFSRDPKILEENEEEEKRRAQASVRAYSRQLWKGKMFLHEAPKMATSWKDADTEWLISQPGVYQVDGPMCRWSA